MKTKLLILSALALLFHATSWAYDFESGGIYYNITSSDDKTVQVTYGNSQVGSYSGEVTIPETVTYNGNTYTVTSIGSMAFNSCAVTKVNFNNSIEAIYGSAFGYCGGLTEVTLPESLTYIGGTAFAISGLKTITIPKSVTSIATDAFYSCSSLTTVDFNATACTSAGSSSNPAFRSCSSLSTINFGTNVTIIPNYLCYECTGLTGELNIPNNVTSIGEGAFYRCTGFTSMVIPESVTSIGSSAFSGCTGLTSVTSNNPEPPTCQSNTFNNVPTTTCPLTVPEGKEDDYASATGWKNFRHINDKLYGGEVGDKIEVDGIYYNVTADTELEVTWGGSSRTAGTSSYTGTVSIPETVVYNKVTYTVTGIGEYAFYGCSNLTSVTIGDNVTSIGTYAFYNCSSLTSAVNIPDGVTSIGERAFYQCSSLTSVSIPGSVKSIGDYAFIHCDSLASVTLAEGLTSIGTQSLEYCAFEELVIPNSVTSIGAIAIARNDKLKRLTIGKGVTSLTNRVFINNTILEEVTSLNPTPPTCSSGVFTDSPISSCTLYVPTGSSVAYSSATEWKDFGTIVEYYPAVQTDDATDVTDSSATLNGSVTAGSGNVTGKGFEYWTDDSEKTNIEGTEAGDEGTITTTLSSLEEATTYSYRAYATTTDAGTSDAMTIYGDTKTFTTLNATLLSNLVTAITEVKDSLEEAWTAIQADYPDVVEELTADYDSLSAELDTLLATTKEAYTAGTLNEETETSVTESLTSITASIAKLSADAKTAENGYLYGIISEMIEAVQTELTTAWETITDSCSSVIVEKFTEEYEAIATELTTLSETMKTAKEAETLIQDSVTTVTETLATIKEKIEKLSTDAVAAEENYQLYTATVADIEAMQTELKEAWETIIEECSNVADTFEETYNDLASQLATLLTSTESAYNEGTLTDEAVEKVEDELATISASITDLLADAKTAENEYLYGIISDKIEAVETELTTAWETITDSCSSVIVEKFTEEYEAIATELTTLSETMKTAKEAETLIQDSVTTVTETLATIKEKIEKLSTDAVAAEENYQLYTTTVADIEAVQTELKEAWETIIEECSNVADTFEETYSTLTAQLEALVDSTEETYEAGLLTEEKVEEVEAELATISASIADLLADAKTAENAYLYGIISDKIEAVETELTTVWETIETECADVAGTFKTDYEAIVTDLTTLKQDTESAYEGEELTQETVEEVEETLATISSSIADLLADAKTAENAYLYNMLYEDAVSKVEATEESLASAWETIQTKYSYMVEELQETHDNILAEIEAVRTELDEAYEAGELTEDAVAKMEEELAAIEKEIEDMLSKTSIATGIESARSDFGDDVRIYNLAGSRVHNLERGNIYILRYSDGTTKKVLVK